MEDLLIEWKISPDTISVFRNNDIDISCLEGLGNEELKILIPDDKIKDRIKFKIGYQRYKNEIATVHSNIDSLDTEDNLSLSSFSDDINSTGTSKSEINLQQVLNNTMHGRQALAAIRKNKMNTSAYELRRLRGFGVLHHRRQRTDSQMSETERTDYDTNADVEIIRWLKFSHDHWPLVEQKWDGTCAYA